MSEATELQYKLAWEIRRDIADAVVETDRQYTAETSGFTKTDLIQVADAIGVQLDDPTLTELYIAISDRLGLEPPTTAGNDWGLHKPHLKAIHRRVVDD